MHLDEHLNRYCNLYFSKFTETNPQSRISFQFKSSGDVQYHGFLLCLFTYNELDRLVSIKGSGCIELKFNDVQL